jgi:hypothetical protein
MYCTSIGIQLPHADKQHKPFVPPGTEKLSTCASVLTIAGTSRMSCASTAIVKPNIPQNPFEAAREPGYCAILQFSSIKWLWADRNACLQHHYVPYKAVHRVLGWTQHRIFTLDATQGAIQCVSVSSTDEACTSRPINGQ